LIAGYRLKHFKSCLQEHVLMQEYDYDFFVIGAGSGGVRAARTAAALGARTGIAEARFFGGTCVNVGCVPKKLYTYAAHASQDFADSAGYGWTLGTQARFDWATLKRNKDQEIKRLNGIYRSLLSNAGVDIHECRATLTGPNRVLTARGEVSARHILLAVGGRSSIPTFPGSEFVMDSDDFFDIAEQPASVLIVGGGYIATELAGIFAGLGTQVTLVHRGPILLKGFDHDIQSFFTEAVQAHVDLRLNTEVAHIEQQGSGIQNRYCVRFLDGSQLEVGAVLFATGRSPATAEIGLEAAGVNLTTSGAILVDQHFQTNIPGIYAVGDVIERVTLTPVALAEGQALANWLFGGVSPDPLTYEMIPSAVFSDPQIASVGLTEEQARQRFEAVKIYRSRFRPMKHTLSGRQSFSLMKMIVDQESDRVVGIHMAGTDAAEIMQGMAVAMQAGATKKQFDATIGIHPTAAEEFVTMRTAVQD
jgi:glutathione reductase (NADPH)